MDPKAVTLKDMLIVFKQKRKFAIGIVLAVCGLCVSAFGAGTIWQWVGLLSAASGGAIFGTWLKDR